MSLLEPALVERLTRTRLNSSAKAVGGVGERPSGVAESGIEFADHRPYEPGDDLRHIDPHIYARTGHHIVRQYVSHGALSVTILIDASASMAMGEGTPKLVVATRLAAALAVVAVHGGDRVRVGAFREASVDWHPGISSPRGLPELFRHLEVLTGSGSTDLASLAAIAAPRLPVGGMLIVIGDWLAKGITAALTRWRHDEQDLVAIQVLAPEELEPERLGSGALDLLDSESGRTVSVILNDEGFARYRSRFEAWRSELVRDVGLNGGRFLMVRTDEDLSKIIFTDWRKRGLLH